MIEIILFILALSGVLAWLWVKGIDHMKEKHPEYKGDDFLDWTEDEKKDIL